MPRAWRAGCARWGRSSARRTARTSTGWSTSSRPGASRTTAATTPRVETTSSGGRGRQTDAARPAPRRAATAVGRCARLDRGRRHRPRPHGPHHRPEPGRRAADRHGRVPGGRWRGRDALPHEPVGGRDGARHARRGRGAAARRRAGRAAARALDRAPPPPRGGQHPPRAERRRRAAAPVAGLGGGRAAHRLRPEPAPGAGRPRAADAGLLEPGEERPRGARRDGRAPALDPPRGPLPHPPPLGTRALPLRAGRGHGAGHPRGAPGTALLALLLDQGARHGPGPRPLPAHRRRTRRDDRLRAAAGPRGPFSRDPSREPGHGAVSTGDARAAAAGSILIADDEESIRWVLERACAQQGHSVVAVGSGAAALAELRARPFDVALIDIKMPDLSGLDVLQQAREARIDTLFIIMTAQNTMANAIEATKRGAYDQ